MKNGGACNSVWYNTRAILHKLTCKIIDLPRRDYAGFIVYMVLITALAPLSSANGFPLSTEDTGTLSQDRTKLEFILEQGDEKRQGAHEMSLTNELSLAHGLQDHLDVFLSLFYHTVRVERSNGSQLLHNGNGDTRTGIKWRFYTDKQLSMGIKMGLSLPSGDESKELGTGKTNPFINVIASYAALPWGWHMDIGYRHNHNLLNQRENLWHVSTAVTRKFGDHWKVMIDVASDVNRNPNSNEHPVSSTAGLAVAISKQAQLDLGLKYGLTDTATDVTFLAGVNVKF